MCRVVAGGGGVLCAVGPRYWIETTRMPRMASSYAPQAQPAASERAEPVDCLERIVGTGRMESACGTEKRAHGPLVNSNQERGNVAHCAFYYSILILTTRRIVTLRIKLACYALPQRAQTFA
jgi:hypothetical protein